MHYIYIYIYIYIIPGITYTTRVAMHVMTAKHHEIEYASRSPRAAGARWSDLGAAARQQTTNIFPRFTTESTGAPAIALHCVQRQRGRDSIAAEVLEGTISTRADAGPWAILIFYLYIVTSQSKGTD